MANVLATNSEFTKVYKTFIYPQLNGVLDDIISGKIDNEYQLKESFYKMISDIKNYDFNLYYGIRGWIPQYK
jgi:hypothetical protein